MLGKKLLIPVIILLLFFANLIMAEGKTTTSAPDSSVNSGSAEVVQLQEDSAPASTPILTENPAAPETSVTEPSESVNKSAVKVAEKPATTVSRGTTTPSRAGKVITMVSTGYDGCYECNKPYYGYPSYIGLPLAHGIVAVDPKVIPMGTRLYVEGYGEAIAADQGNAIKGNRIDLFFDSHQQALNYGMKTVKVTILD